MKKPIIFYALICGLLYANNSFGMSRIIGRSSHRILRFIPQASRQKRHLLISEEEVHDCIRTLERLNHSIINLVSENKEKTLHCIPNEDRLRLQRIQEHYATAIINHNKQNIERFAKGGIIALCIPERELILFHQFERLIKDKDSAIH